MAALPVYVHVPKLYGDERGLALATVGVLLLAVRALDALQDPVLGWWSDRTAVRHGRKPFLAASVLLLALGVLALFRPPALGPDALAVWLGISLVVTYVGFSMGTINYFTLGAELSGDVHRRTHVTAARGAAGVIGVLIASALPQAISGSGQFGKGLEVFALLYIPVLLAGAAAVIFGVAEPRRSLPQPASGSWRDMMAPLADHRFRRLLGICLASGVASAIPATLFLFYVEDVLNRPALSGVFLAQYFLFGAAAMPLWVNLSRRAGKRIAWMIAMAGSIAAFVWAYLLGPGDALAFTLVCALSGLAYGAELALPASLLADIAGDTDRTRARQGAYFGTWQLVEKLNLALAAGISLPLLQWSGYEPGTPQGPMGDLSVMYAVVPCALKAVAVWMLWRTPFETTAVPPHPTGGKPS
ncbi:MAG: MFS transporter [Betaproteobacteria bacterium]|nr:MFS transporter [Betaproteobacteria bacterium]